MSGRILLGRGTYSYREIVVLKSIEWSKFVSIEQKYLQSFAQEKTQNHQN